MSLNWIRANPLARLRFAFLALGTLLLTSVLILLHSALSRLDREIDHRAVLPSSV